jgi:cyclopropane-fatty-acyl-phospholipid synthase
VILSSPSLSSQKPVRDTPLRPGLAARLLDRMLPPLQAGRLQVVLPNGEAVERPGARPGPESALALRHWRALWRILLEGEDGFSDSYIDGDWTTPDLAALLDLGVHNEAVLEPRTKNWLLNLARNRLLHTWRANTRRGSRRNIAAHYDLGNQFFREWLDAGMNYSSALFRGAANLEQAQLQKLDRIAELLELRGGERVLEIGCGWGALAERLIGRYGASVFGITLSAEQLSFAKARLAGEIANGRADFRLLDYRDVPGRFDRIASVEMIEAVGEHYWPAYFTKLRDCLAAGGAALLQAITIDDSRFAQYRKRPDFIQRHIFPGGMLPTRDIIKRQAEQAGLNLVAHESFGDSYARTLQEWRTRFIQAWPKLEALGFNQRFHRMWEYYLAYCETGFRCGAIDVGFYKLAG